MRSILSAPARHPDMAIALTLIIATLIVGSHLL
ncbi:hypothetical protein GGD81_001342 [Rhodobium orientis]|nr:hypothetical protein [Rhodobium orientis]